MRYFALYQRQFSGRPRVLGLDSHVFVDHTSADNLEEVFARFQVEEMTETRLSRVALSPVRHTSMSVGDYLIGETGACFAVMPVGFRKAGYETFGARIELALHLLALGLEGTPGWNELFEDEAARLSAAIFQRLRDDSVGVARYVLKHHPFAIPFGGI